MKYTVETDVNLSPDETMNMLMDMDFMKEWHEGLVETERMTGTIQDEGSMYKHIFNLNNGKRFEMMETIVKVDRDHHDCELLFETDRMIIHSMNHLEGQGEHTRWINENKSNYKGMKKLMTPFRKGKEMRHLADEMEKFAACAGDRMHHLQ